MGIRAFRTCMALVLALAACGSPPSSPVPGETGTSAPPASGSPIPAASVTGEPVDSNCIEFDAESTYLFTVGTLPVSLTVPASPSQPWHGSATSFSLARGSCAAGADAVPYFHAALVGRVYADACHWTAATVEAPTASDVIKELKRQVGHPPPNAVETELGFFRATRLDIPLPRDFDVSGCDEGEMRLWADELLAPGVSLQVYVAEVDGASLVVTVGFDAATTTPADLEEIDAILASLRVEM